MPTKDHYFVIHSKKDHQRVAPIIKHLQSKNYMIWADTMLNPGENWVKTIDDILRRARGLLVFISNNSLQEKAVQQQLDIIRRGNLTYVIPIMLEDVELPPELLTTIGIDITGSDTPTASAKIEAAIKNLPEKEVDISCLESDQVEDLAQTLANTRRGTKYSGDDQSAKSRIPDSIFIVHGHDIELRDEVEQTLRDWGIETVILQQIDAVNDSLFQKFLTFSEDVEFAVVLLTADDYGASRRQYDAPNVGDRALQFRARQNVILELGFFYGYLGWENVFVLFKPAQEVFPNFEIPSDLGGILFDQVDNEGKWQTQLANRLQQAGFILPMS